MTEEQRKQKKRAYHRAYAIANRERIRQNKRKWRASFVMQGGRRALNSSDMTLKTQTESGGWKHDLSTSWNTKLTLKQIRQKSFVSSEQLYREIAEGYYYFWSKRKELPTNPHK